MPVFLPHHSDGYVKVSWDVVLKNRENSLLVSHSRNSVLLYVHRISK